MFNTNIPAAAPGVAIGCPERDGDKHGTVKLIDHRVDKMKRLASIDSANADGLVSVAKKTTAGSIN